MTGSRAGHTTPVRIATFNLLSGRAPCEESVDELKYAAAIVSLDADVLGLQEVGRNQPRSGRLDVVTTHLSFLSWWNGRQLRALVADLD